MGPIDGDGNVGGMFSGGDPAVPRLPTQVTSDWLNDIQEELLNVITTGGGTPVKGAQTQVLTALLEQFLDVTGSANQSVALLKLFLDGLTVTRTTPNSTAIRGTGSGSGAGGSLIGGSGASSAGPGVSSNGGVPTGSTGNAADGGTLDGGTLNQTTTGNTAGAAGNGLTLNGGNVVGDTHGRKGGTGLVVQGGTGQGGQGKAIDATGDVAVSGALTAGSIVSGAPVAVTTGSGVGTYANGWGANTSGSNEGAHYSIDPMGKKALSGSVVGGASLSVGFVLPTVYRPTAERQFNVSTSIGVGVSATVLIDMSGNVTIEFTGGGSSTVVYLDSINYF